MTEENIQSILDKLGNRVSHLSEENRICKLQNNAGKELINQLESFIGSDDWVSIYESSDNPFVKDLMKEWGLHLFPKHYKIR